MTCERSRYNDQRSKPAACGPPLRKIESDGFFSFLQRNRYPPLKRIPVLWTILRIIENLMDFLMTVNLKPVELLVALLIQVLRQRVYRIQDPLCRSVEFGEV